MYALQFISIIVLGYRESDEDGHSMMKTIFITNSIPYQRDGWGWGRGHF